MQSELKKRKRQGTGSFQLIVGGFFLLILFGALMPMDFAWTLADITMGGMTLINIPCCLLLSKYAIGALRDYEKHKKAGSNPVFHAAEIGLNPDELSFWK